MDNQHQLLYTVKEVFQEYLNRSENSLYYFIPLYQRGYKWSKNNICKLLDDINSFKPENTKFYCLQNITIVSDSQELRLNVVDGQQRLTTLSILLTFLGAKDLVKGKVKFPKNSIRKETNEFINNFVFNNTDTLSKETWEVFIAQYPRYDHQDIFHIFIAYRTIQEWFNGKTRPSKEDFLLKILNHVKIIINLVSGENNEEKIFGNLNTKRVPLDGADLVRAILITNVAKEEGERESNLKNVIRVNERRIKIGWEIDQISNWWSQSEISEYFKSFISIKSELVGSRPLFDKEKHPLNLLLLLFAEQNNKKELTLDFIESQSSSALELYKKLIKFNSTLQDWYQDREIYHFLGFLFNQSKIEFSTIWQNWSNIKSREDFKSYLKNRIKQLILDKKETNTYPSVQKAAKPNESDEKEFELFNCTEPNTDWYNDKNDKLTKTLILLDVIHCIKPKQNFMPPIAFAKGKNDIEHIFPQNPKEEDSFEKKKEYVQFLNKYILNKDEQFDLNKNNEDAVSKFIQKQINAIPINSIGNLVLLYSSLNRSLGRISYSKKRACIIQHFNEGNYIQPHTFKVFARYFNDIANENKELEHWTKKDIEANGQRIEQEINLFFNQTA